MSEELDKLADAVAGLRAAEERAREHCGVCGAGHSLAVEQARANVVYLAQLLVEREEVAA